jgi:hypothetical protein
VDDQSPDHKDIDTMRPNNPFLRFHRTAEAAGDPALLFVRFR